LEDNGDFNPFSNTLKDLLAHEETQSRKRVRVKNTEDEDDSVKIVSIASSAPDSTVSTSNSKSIATKTLIRPRKSKSTKYLWDPSSANKAAAQLMGKAKLSLTLQQIGDLASSFRAEVRRILLKPRKGFK